MYKLINYFIVNFNSEVFIHGMKSNVKSIKTVHLITSETN